MTVLRPSFTVDGLPAPLDFVLIDEASYSALLARAECAPDFFDRVVCFHLERPGCARFPIRQPCLVPVLNTVTARANTAYYGLLKSSPEIVSDDADVAAIADRWGVKVRSIEDLPLPAELIPPPLLRGLEEDEDDSEQEQQAVEPPPAQLRGSSDGHSEGQAGAEASKEKASGKEAGKE